MLNAAQKGGQLCTLLVQRALCLRVPRFSLLEENSVRFFGCLLPKKSTAWHAFEGEDFLGSPQNAELPLGSQVGFCALRGVWHQSQKVNKHFVLTSRLKHSLSFSKMVSDMILDALAVSVTMSAPWTGYITESTRSTGDVCSVVTRVRIIRNPFPCR